MKIKAHIAHKLRSCFSSMNLCSIIKLKSHISFSKIQEPINLLFVNISTPIDICFAHAAAALPVAEPAATAPYGEAELLLADPPVLVDVEFHQPNLELLHRHLVLAAAGQAASGVATCYCHWYINIRVNFQYTPAVWLIEFEPHTPVDIYLNSWKKGRWAI